MGFWKTLGKIAMVAAPIAAVPFTGGTSLLGMLGAGGAAGAAGGAGAAAAGGGMLSSILGNAGRIGGAIAPILGGMAQGRQQGQQQDYQNEVARGNQANQALLQEMQAQILAQNQNRNMQSQRLGDTVRGDIINHLADVRIPDNGRVQVQHFSGGLRPSTMTGNSRAAGKLFSDNSLYALQNEGGIQAPDLTQNVADLPQNGFMDNLLGIAGPAASLAGGLFGQGGPFGQGGGSNTIQGPGMPPPERDAYTDRKAWEELLADPMRGMDQEGY